MFPTKHCCKNTLKRIGAHLRDMMGQSLNPFIPNQMHYFISLHYILQQLEETIIKAILEKNLVGQKVSGTWNNVHKIMHN